MTARKKSSRAKKASSRATKTAVRATEILEKLDAEGFTPKELRFVQEYPLDLNGAAAARRSGYSEATAKSIACELLSKPHIQAAIAAAQAKRAEKLEITADQLTRRFWLIASADPNELVQFRRTCCRHCYGSRHEYQHTNRELEVKRAQHNAAIAIWDKTEEAKRGPKPEFSEDGGPGFNHTQAPAADCPECFGEGEGDAFLQDTRKLSPAALALYAGVKVTKDGIEVKMHDQQAAAVNVGKLLGFFVERNLHDVGPSLEDILTKSHQK